MTRSDGSPVNFLAFTPGEPNNWRVQGSNSMGMGNVGNAQGEDVVSVTFGNGRYPGGWNDEHENGKMGLATESGTQMDQAGKIQVRFLTEILDDFRRFVDEIWRF